MWSGKLNYEFWTNLPYGGGHWVRVVVGKWVRESVGNRYDQSYIKGMKSSLKGISSVES